MKKVINLNIILGIFLIVIGVIVALNSLNININIDYALVIWTFVTLFGIVIVINDKKFNVVSSIIIVVGLWNTLRVSNAIDTSLFSLIWPSVIIVVGLNLIFSGKVFNKLPKISKTEEILTYNGVFGGVDEKVTFNNFKAIEVNALFGGVDLDLRDITFKHKEIVLNLSSMFAAISIIFPNECNVKIADNMSVFGGIENKVKNEFIEGRTTIYINSKAIFGGIELK